MITTQKALRAAFWEAHPQFKRRVRPTKVHVNGTQVFLACTQNEYPTDVRVTWVDFVDSMRRDGRISDALAGRATL